MSRVGFVTETSCNLQVLGKYLSSYWKKQVKVTDATVERATAKGNNFVSDPWRVKFTYTEENMKGSFTDTVIVKTRLTNENHDTMMNAEIAFKNEILAYEKVIPALNTFVCSPLRVPSYIHGDVTSIVMEDMCKRSFHPNTKKIANDWNQVWSPIQEMAKLHAASIIMQKEDKKSFDALVNAITEIPLAGSTPLGDKQATALENISLVLEDIRTPDAEKYKAAVKAIKNGENPWIRQKSIIEKEVDIRVINHGTIWINNYLFNKDMITLLDWQDIRLTSPAVDLGYFLYLNLDTDFYSMNRKRLLEFYLMHLHQYIYDSRTKQWSSAEIEEVLQPLNFQWIHSELLRCNFHSYMMALWITPVYSWSEAVFQHMESIGGLENMPVAERMKHMTPDQKDRIVKLTKLYMEESNTC